MNDAHLSKPSGTDDYSSLVKNLVRTRIPTRHGEFFLYYYNNVLEPKEHLAIVKGDVKGATNVAVRLHSECLTGDVFGSLRCDCGDQLDRALRIIGQESCGVLLYLRQEGRGIGLLKKLQAYNLQDEGLDTVEANLRLGHRSDERDYSIAAGILQDLKIRSVRLITNNPAKIDQLRKLGVEVSDRIPIEIPFNKENEGYLRTKARKMQHILSLKVKQKPTGEFGFLAHLCRIMEERVAQDTSLPFVTITRARTLDGDAYRRSSMRRLCSDRTGRMLDFLESRHDATLITMQDLGDDGDWLNTLSPRIVVLAPNAQSLSALAEIEAPGKILIAATTDPLSLATAQQLQNRGVTIAPVAPDIDAHQNCGNILESLAAMGIRSLLVGGASCDDWIAQGTADYGVVAIIPRFGAAETTPASAPGCEPAELQDCQYHLLDRDMIVYGHF